MSALSLRKALESGRTSPDSTTVAAKFAEGDEVLCHNKDGRFYLGKVTDIDEARARCLVQYGDGTQAWSQYRHVTRLPGQQEACCVCNSARAADDNEIVHCVSCRLPFHQSCVEPRLKLLLPGWTCGACRAAPQKRLLAPAMKLVTDEYKKTLPYDPKSLSWTSDHKVNREQTYCYCAGPGDWFNRMLQCFQCRQWYHEVCVECLQYPLLNGDRYYIFVCGVCNGGTELVKRLDIRWQEVVHLALFNLTIRAQKRYHDLDAVLLPWIDEHWDLLQAPIYLQTVPYKLRRGEVLRVLQDAKNKSSFQSGRENKKRPGLWSLRVKAPPPPPVVDLRLNGGPITEYTLKAVRVHYSTRKNKKVSPVKLKRKMAEEGVRAEPNGLFPTYGAVKKRATTECPGARCRSPGGNSDGIESPPTPPPPRLLRVRAKPAPAPAAAAQPPPPLQQQSVERVSAPPAAAQRAAEPPTPAAAAAQQDKARTVPAKRGRKQRPALKTTCKSAETSSDEASSRGTLDALIPPSFNFDGSNNPFSGLIGTLVTRQLSEKDIVVSKTGEVRRRRKRRLRRTVSSGGAAAGWADVGALFGGGASGRRSCSLLARRTSADGHVQYLVEWHVL